MDRWPHTIAIGEPLHLTPDAYAALQWATATHIKGKVARAKRRAALVAIDGGAPIRRRRWLTAVRDE